MGYNKIVLQGEQICDYLYIQKSNANIDTFTSIDSEPANWADNTLLLSKFDGNLIAGNSALVGSIDGYEIRKRKGVELNTEYVTTITNDMNMKGVIDYMVASNTAYTYYLYPISNLSNSGITLTPLISKQVTPSFNFWSLFVVDETDEKNVFHLNKMFKFELNLTTDDMSNNATITVNSNFTHYPTVQIGTTNYWSGSLSALCGFIECNDCEYVETPNLIDEFKKLTSDTRRKFLKDMDGHIWEIAITSPISVSTEDYTIQRVKTVKLSWVEVGDASGVSIINNPYLTTTSWLLTDNGIASPYIDYIWDNEAIWDNSKYWTAKDDVLETTISNMGRDLYKKVGDET